MKKTFSVSEPVSKRLEKVAKERGIAMSTIVESALTIYFLLDLGDLDEMAKLSEKIPKGQRSIFEAIQDAKRASDAGEE